MNWADQVKATALTVAAERTAAVGRIAVDTPWSFDAHDVWLSRVRQPRDRDAQSGPGSPTTQTRQGIALRD
jgi:hypothetical protein